MQNYDIDVIKPEKEIILRKSELRKPAYTKPIISDAEKIIRLKIPETYYSAFRMFHLTGDRLEYQKPMRQKRSNLLILAMASYLTQRKDFVLKLEDYIWDICNEPNWCMPAHLPELLDFNKKYIDLLSAETARMFAEIFLLLGDILDTSIKNRIEYEVENRIFIPFFKHPDEYWWFKRYDSNWCAVCCGEIGTSTICMAREKPYFHKIMQDIINSINSYFDCLDSLGGWVEGISYWNYGMTNAVRFADTLYRSTDGKINLFTHPKIQVTGLFPVYCFLPPDGFVNFGDAPRNTSLNRETMLLLGKHTNSASQISYLSEQIKFYDYQDIRSLREIPITAPLPPKETFVHYKDIGWVITRKNWKEKTGPVFAIKAGNNNEPHNHLDIGQFIFHVFGQDYLCDWGSGLYTKDYFSSKRYENPFCNTDGHSVIFIDGISQQPGSQYCGKIVEATTSDQQDLILLDMTDAYPGELVEKIVRSIRFSKKEKYGKLFICDSILTKGKRTIETRIQFNGTLKKINKSYLILQGKNGKIAINITEPEKFLLSFGVFKNQKPHHGNEITMKFLKITAEKTNKVNFSIEITPIS